MLKYIRDLLFLTCFLVLFGSAVSAQVTTPVVSTFDTSVEGWSVAPDQNATIDFQGSGGAPDGFVLMTSGGSGRCDIEAPAAYLGDWSHLDTIGILQFDHKIFDLGGAPIGPPYKVFEVVLEGGGVNSARFFSMETAQITWTTAIVPLQEQLWYVESGDWASLLSNVDTVQIRIELVGNDALPDDMCGIDNVKLAIDATSSTVPDVVSPTQNVLRSAYPNPFNPTVTLEFELAKPASVSIVIYGADGRPVRRLIDNELSASLHTVQWDGRDGGGTRVGSGVYFARMSVDGIVSMKEMVLLK